MFLARGKTMLGLGKSLEIMLLFGSTEQTQRIRLYVKSTGPLLF